MIQLPRHILFLKKLIFRFYIDQISRLIIIQRRICLVLILTHNLNLLGQWQSVVMIMEVQNYFYVVAAWIQRKMHVFLMENVRILNDEIIFDIFIIFSFELRDLHYVVHDH